MGGDCLAGRVRLESFFISEDFLPVRVSVDTRIELSRAFKPILEMRRHFVVHSSRLSNDAFWSLQRVVVEPIGLSAEYRLDNSTQFAFLVKSFSICYGCRDLGSEFGPSSAVHLRDEPRHVLTAGRHQGRNVGGRSSPPEGRASVWEDVQELMSITGGVPTDTADDTGPPVDCAPNTNRDKRGMPSWAAMFSYICES